jgi:hypothetical protein
VMLQIIKCSFLFPPPHEIFPVTTLSHLAEGPCNMGESQHKPLVEFFQSQKASNLSECGRGWLVTNDLDLSWINMYTMFINNVAQVLDHVHAKGAFFQVGI